jgi:tetratricopeptide (TPR) repeat protein
MSYINEALRKAKKEKGPCYAAYGNIVSAPGKKLNRPRKWLAIIGLSIVLLAGIIALMCWPEVKKVPATQAMELVRTPVVVKAIIAPAEPQIVKETTADKNNRHALNREKSFSEIKVKPENNDAKIIYEQALQRQREGKLKEAKELYEKVIKIDPRNVQALNNLGVIYMNMKTYKWAIMRFNDAIKIKHNYPDAHYNLACLYAQKNDATRSLLYLKNAIRYNPEVRHWAENDGDLNTMVDLPEFKKLLEKQ